MENMPTFDQNLVWDALSGWTEDLTRSFKNFSINPLVYQLGGLGEYVSCNNEEQYGTCTEPLADRIVLKGATEDEGFDEVHVTTVGREVEDILREQHWVLDCKHLDKHHWHGQPSHELLSQP